MRLKIIILSLLLFIAFLSLTALCVDWANPSYNATEMLSSGEVTVYTNPTGFAATPQAQRELEKNKSSLDWTMPSTLTGGGSSAKESRSQAEAASQEAETSTTATSTATGETTTASATSTATDTELPPAQAEEPEVAGVEGSWYFVLSDSAERDLAVILFQKGNDVFGAGKIKEGESTLDVTASGSVADSALDLNVVSLGTISLYKLKLDLSEGSASGEYQAYSSGSDSWTGSAEGEKTA
ncbi:MAG: hypothetical protein A4E49_01011 [Methanosaeta sp. PtaU1.Bin112]|nr:MAG: hypothetical protein A4E49_01011 [Methanosaeta sp. PtaU1.Bin112]